MLTLKNNACEIKYDPVSKCLLCQVDKKSNISCEHKGCICIDCIVEILTGRYRI